MFRVALPPVCVGKRRKGEIIIIKLNLFQAALVSESSHFCSWNLIFMVFPVTFLMHFLPEEGSIDSLSVLWDGKVLLWTHNRVFYSCSAVADCGLWWCGFVVRRGRCSTSLGLCKGICALSQLSEAVVVVRVASLEWKWCGLSLISYCHWHFLGQRMLL